MFRFSHLWSLVSKALNPEPPPGYRVYTRKFDKVVHASEGIFHLDDGGNQFADDKLWTLPRSSIETWREAANLHAEHNAKAIRSLVDSADLKNSAITLLVDQSGSMRDLKINHAALAVEHAAGMLLELGCAVEVLGFTTASWKGGNSRKQWLSEGLPRFPGRLCDLQHIVYRSANEQPVITASTVSPMVHRHNLHENVDGEALQWALSRLRDISASRRILVVLSDGAPVDDSTLMQNSGSFLEDHLVQVIADVEAAGDITLAAVGIGYGVDRFYRNSIGVEEISGLSGELCEFLQKLLTQDYAVPEKTVESAQIPQELRRRLAEAGLFVMRARFATLDAARQSEIREIIASGNRTNAIKRYRELTKCGLKEAEELVESLER